MAKQQASPEQGSRSRTSLYKLLKVPLKMLCKARDFYFVSMGVYGYNGMQVFPTVVAPQVVSTNVPKSFSVNNSSYNSNRSELRRASSARSSGEKQGEQAGVRGGGQSNSMVLARSRSVNIGRIDEDEPCDDFGDVIKPRRELLVYPRSRSHSVVHRTRAW